MVVFGVDVGKEREDEIGESLWSTVAIRALFFDIRFTSDALYTCPLHRHHRRQKYHVLNNNTILKGGLRRLSRVNSVDEHLTRAPCGLMG